MTMIDSDNMTINRNNYVVFDQKEQQQEERKFNQWVRGNDESTQFGVAWSPPSPSSLMQEQQGRYLFSCLNTGIICCWDVFGDQDNNIYDNVNNPDEDEQTANSDMNNKINKPPFLSNENNFPLLQIKVSSESLYNLHFYKCSSQWFLSVCGDDGINIYKWVDIYTMIIKAQSNKQSQTQTMANKMTRNKTMCVDLKSLAHYQPYPPPSNHLHPYHPHSYPNFQLGNEINATGVDEARSVLFGAGGDSSEKCYQWDLETQKLIGIMSNSSRSEKYPYGNDHNSHYLHSVCVVPGGNGQILTGGEDGNLGLWDAKQNKLIQMIQLGDFIFDSEKDREFVQGQEQSNETIKQSGFKNYAYTSNQKKYDSLNRKQKLNGWISKIDVEESGNWAVIGGGIDIPNKKNSKSNDSSQSSLDDGGFIALWHLPSRTIACSHKTREQIQSVCYDSSHDSIVTCGNENVVSYWSWCAEKRQERVWCSPSSCFGLSINERNGMLATCGIGNVVDCFTHVGHKSFSLEYR